MEHKIKARLAGERILVNAKFTEEDKIVHEINTAFPLDSSEKEIRKEVVKAGELFELEKEQAKDQAEVDKKFGKAQKTITSLNS